MGLWGKRLPPMNIDKKIIPAKKKPTVITKKPANSKKIKQQDWWTIYQNAKEDNWKGA